MAAQTQPIKFITGADPFGATLKDALITHLNFLNIPVQDLGVGPYYSIAAQIGRLISTTTTNTTTYGLAVCGTGTGVQIFANKFPGVYAATCLTIDDAINTRSINNANVITFSGASTPPETAVKILDAFINTPFKAPCSASNHKDWDPELQKFLDESVAEMAKIGVNSTERERAKTSTKSETVYCAICCLVKNREFEPVEIMPGGMMKIVRESPTSAIVKFKGGSVEPAHHHTFGHDLVVMKGSKRVWNLSKDEKYDLGVGDYLFTPAGDVHRVKYFEDTEFFIKWDGHWDIFLDEDLETAHAAIAKDV